MMSRQLPRRAFLAALALASSVALPIRAGAQATLEGTLEQVDTARRTIVLRTGDATRTVQLGAQTIIAIDGFPGDVRDLRPGQRVRVQLAVTRGGATRDEAVRIDVRARAR